MESRSRFQLEFGSSSNRDARNSTVGTRWSDGLFDVFNESDRERSRRLSITTEVLGSDRVGRNQRKINRTENNRRSDGMVCHGERPKILLEIRRRTEIFAIVDAADDVSAVERTSRRISSRPMVFSSKKIFSR